MPAHKKRLVDPNTTKKSSKKKPALTSFDSFKSKAYHAEHEFVGRLHHFGKKANLTLGVSALLILFFVEITIVITGVALQKYDNTDDVIQSTDQAAAGENSTTTGSATNENNSTHSNILPPEKVDPSIPDAIYCDSDENCSPIFSNCSCSYSCVNPEQYNKIKRVECNAICNDLDVQGIINCTCKNNKCSK